MRDDEIRRSLRLDGPDEVDEELAFHRASVVDELMAAGRTRSEAEAEARRRFGDEVRYRTQIGSIDRANAAGARVRAFLSVLRDGFRSALRGVRRSPGLTVAILLSFALGIGANATMYGMIERLWLRAPDGIADATQVRRLFNDRAIASLPQRIVGGTFSYPDFVDLREVEGFEAVAGYRVNTVTMGRGPDARTVEAQLVTGNFFELVGVRPALGRFFIESEDRRDGDAVVVLAWSMWQSAFGGDPSVLGRIVDLEYGVFTVIGVAPRGFTGPDLTPVAMWLPLQFIQQRANGGGWVANRNWWFVRAVARLRDGVTVERAQAEATSAFRNSRRSFIDSGEEAADPVILAASLIAARGPTATAETRVTVWLGLVAIIVLLVACMNVANLLLSRATRQRHETAVRLALGVSRSRLFGQLLVEGIALAIAGAVAALILAQWGGAWMRGVLMPGIAWGRSITPRLIAFTLIAALFTGFVCALLPALQSIGRAPVGGLRGMGGVSARGGRIRSLLSGAQAAFSVLLLVGAGLFIRSLHQVRTLDIGFDLRDVFAARPVLDQGPGVGDATLDLSAVRERVAGLPGVRAAAVVSTVPLDGSWAIDFRADGVDSVSSALGGPYVYAVSHEFFDVVGLAVLEGRAFAGTDLRGAARVAVINRTMARTLWPNGDALGKCLYLEGAGACTRVAGIAADARRESIREEPQLLYYIPIDQAPVDRPPARLLVRAVPGATGLAETLRVVMTSADPRVRFAEIIPLHDLMEPEMRSWTLGASLFSVFGALALCIAGIGLYSVLAFDVDQRTREIGLRCALGAGRPAILALVVGRALGIVTAGLAVGLVAALALSPRIEPLLFDTPARDPLTLGLVCLVLTIVAVVAAFAPAWRASRVDPNIALRAD